MNAFRAALTAIGMGSLALAVFNMNANDRALDRIHYCQEVTVWMTHLGVPELDRPGHPDFDNRYARDCQ